MKYPFLASILILCALFYYERKKADRNYDSSMKKFWDRENEANNTRKKPLDDLQYINIDLSVLPMDIAGDDDVISEKQQDIINLSSEPVVNFTGLTNTDLKLEYGVANLPFLQQCDMNYTVLARTLQEWAQRLYELGYIDQALDVLEYAVGTHSDVSKTYYLAADIYITKNKSHKISELISIAETLNTPLKNSIVSTLKQKLES